MVLIKTLALAKCTPFPGRHTHGSESRKRALPLHPAHTAGGKLAIMSQIIPTDCSFHLYFPIRCTKAPCDLFRDLCVIPELKWNTAELCLTNRLSKSPCYNSVTQWTALRRLYLSIEGRLDISFSIIMWNMSVARVVFFWCHFSDWVIEVKTDSLERSKALSVWHCLLYSRVSIKVTGLRL